MGIDPYGKECRFKSGMSQRRKKGGNGMYAMIFLTITIRFRAKTEVTRRIQMPPEERRKGNGNRKKLILWYTSGFL